MNEIHNTNYEQKENNLNNSDTSQSSSDFKISEINSKYKYVNKSPNSYETIFKKKPKKH